MKAVPIFFLLTSLVLSWIAQAGIEDTLDFGGIDDNFGARQKFKAYWKCGSGFFISDNGFLVTDALTVDGANALVVAWKGKAFEANVVRVCTSNRVAVLKVKGKAFRPVEMSRRNILCKGAKVRAVGNTVSDEDGVGLSVTDCVVSMKTRKRTKVFGTFFKSMSGCPILDDFGRVMGMLLCSGGIKQSECNVVAADSILEQIPRDVVAKLPGAKELSKEGRSRSQVWNEAIALVLAYNDERRQTERATKKEAQPLIHDGQTLTVERLGKIAKSAQEGKTHLEKTGSGFFITDDGYFLTNHHVVEGARELVVVHEGIPYRASLRAESKEKDLALLKVEGSFAPVVVASDRECSVGQTIFVVGFPQIAQQGLEPKVTKGIVSSRSGFRGEPGEYQMDAAIQSGNSGGPVADESGRIVGISVASLINGQNVNYAIKWSSVAAFLPKGVVVKKSNWTNEKRFEDAVSEVVGSSALVLNFAAGGMALDYAELPTDRRGEIESMIRKQILYARLAKLKKQWNTVKSITDKILSVDPGEAEAKELNDTACDELGLHLIVIATVEGRDVSARIEPIEGFKDKWIYCGQPIALQGGHVKGQIVWEEEGKTWRGEIDCVHNWHGTKEISIRLSDQ